MKRGTKVRPTIDVRDVPFSVYLVERERVLVYQIAAIKSEIAIREKTLAEIRAALSVIGPD